MPGIYIHIPFCRSRCIYCGFYSTTLLGLRQQYIKALCKEMQLRKDYIHGTFNTVYIGGGTPSILDADELETLYQYIYKVFPVSPNAEVTMECNPDDVTPDFTETVSRLPVNRISMGAQTFSNKRLSLLRRRHDADDVSCAVNLLREAGIKNISIDLMFGFPGETLAEWASDIEEAVALGVEHISAYSLMYEEGTPLTALLEQGVVEDVGDEMYRTMYDTLVARLGKAGYEHYEISNFARNGFRSQHNSSYWRQVPYIGLGAAAHSFDLKSRQWNISDVRKYISAITDGVIPFERETLNTDTTFNDIITTSLRTCEGIDLEYVENALGKEYKNTLLENAAQHVRDGLLASDGKYLRLTRDGIFISDMIMSDLMIA